MWPLNLNICTSPLKMLQSPYIRIESVKQNSHWLFQYKGFNTENQLTVNRRLKDLGMVSGIVQSEDFGDGAAMAE